MNKKLLFISFLLFPFISKAQLVITPGGGTSAVTSSVGGAGLNISNVVINCDAGAYGAFSGGAASGMGVSNGLILTTGSAASLPGAGNSNDDFDFCVGTTATDPQLIALSPSATQDVCIIEFDVVPQCTSMGITFVFGSDEYTNWVNQAFNDAFGFFVSGPNPGGGTYVNQNIAIIPGGTNVSVDNVSHVTNTAYFVNNNAGTFSNHFDGFTTVLTPSIAVTPCQTYHFKLAIADATDCAMDSGVLIDIIQCNNVTTASVVTTPSTACGVNDGTATVTVNNGLAPLTYVWSPAPGGGQGTTTATGLVAGTTYTVTVDDNYSCIPVATATGTIAGPVAPTVAVNSSTVCAGISTTLTGTPGTGGGTYSWSPGGATTPSITVNPSSTTTYTCSYTLSGCTGTNTGTVTVNPQPTITPVGPVCTGAAAFNLTADVAGGGWSGTGITNAVSGTFTPSSASVGTNVITYSATGGCNDTVHVIVTPSASPAWSQPPPMCVLDAPVNLNSFITGTTGGTWSGTGVTGNMFNPTGLSGNIPVTYTVGTSPCGGNSTLNISVAPNTPPTITSVATQCSSSPAFNLTADIAGGTWSGTGITNAAAGTFDPSTASTAGPNQIIYTVPGSCAGADTILITVIAGPDPSWTTTLLCANNPAISLDALITGTTGGTWSGSGVTGNMFDPTGLSGSIPVTYSVGSACVATSVQNITVVPNADPAWTTTSICQISSAMNLDSLVSGTSGGTWTGTGVSGSTFDPSGLSGNISVTYTVGTAPCQSSSTQNINVVPLSDASWTNTSMCSDDSVINLDPLITGTSGGTWSGTGITGSTFDPTGLSGGIAVTYTVGPVGCQASSSQNITVTPAGNAAWTTTSLCTSSAAINLDALVTGTAGGTWTGTGVTGSMFDPAGLSGNIAVTYIAGSASCPDTLTQNINVVPSTNAAWTSASLCSSASAINLDSLVTGTTGGTWTGTGVTGSSFDPSGLSGPIAVTYTVGPVGCSSDSTQNITVIPAADPAWTTTSLCANATPVNLDAFVTGTSGGSWSGTSVTGSSFDPTGLSGAVAVTYTVGTSPCVSTSVQNITVIPVASAAWTTTALCANATPVNLNTTVTGTAGGTWSGTGVSGSTFDPTGLSGSIPVTYTVGTSPCTSTLTQNIVVTPNADATITAAASMCQDASPVILTAATSGGTWSGTGITNTATGAFDPSVATAGTHTITYSIAGACGDTDTVLVTVLPDPSAAWTLPASICESATPVDLNTLVTGTTGGTFSGSGVTGSTFDPSGLSGNNTITYTVTQGGCSSSTSQVVNVDPIDASFTCTPLTGLSPVSVTTFNTSSNAVSYSWNFGNGATSTATSPSNVYTGMGDYTIILTATNASGCIDTARVLVHVDEISALSVPNVFTPNGDGNNDLFLPVVAEGLSEFKAMVYDRWGLKMSEWTNEEQGWNGKAKNGKPAPDGTYFYIISGKGVDGKAYDFTGFVQLFN
jgi:gliding motility-associated-like protein